MGRWDANRGRKDTEVKRKALLRTGEHKRVGFAPGPRTTSARPGVDEACFLLRMHLAAPLGRARKEEAAARAWGKHSRSLHADGPKHFSPLATLNRVLMTPDRYSSVLTVLAGWLSTSLWTERLWVVSTDIYPITNENRNSVKISKQFISK